LNKPNRHQRVKKWVKATLLLLIIIWIGSVGILARSLLNRAARLQQMAADPAHLNLNVVAGEVHGIRQEFIILRGELAPLLWLGARLGGDLGVAQPLMEAGAESLVAADESLSALTPSLGDLGLSSFSMEQMPQILDALASARPTLARAETHLDAAATALARIEGPLSPRVEGWVSKASQLVQLAQYGIGGAQIAPGLLGQAGSRTYLVLIQNSDELRPTGGFISAVGRLEISHGQLISVTVEDSYAIDDFTKEYPNPPQPLLDYMGSEQWVFRDANWSPDFPTTALDAIHLYQISRPEQVDGVIGMNLKAVPPLMRGLEPLSVDGFPELVTSQNAVSLFRESWNPNPGQSEWIFERKQFVGKVIRAAMDKLFSEKVNWARLGQGTVEALQQRQIMVYTNGPEAQNLNRLNWNGALHPTNGDYLMIVDADVGYSKVASLIAETAEYRVVLNPNGTGRATVTLNYTHMGDQPGVVCMQQFPSYDLSATYQKIMQRCYYDYLRVLVPKGSRLREATPHSAPGAYFLNGKPVQSSAEVVPDEIGPMVIGQFFVVEYGKQLQTQISYDLPAIVHSIGNYQRYSLFVQKQSGTDALPIRVLLTLPPHARLLSADPSPSIQSDGSIQFDIQLDTARTIEVIYAPIP